MTSASGTGIVKAPMRAVVYCRVSSAGQEDNSSLETQEERCRSFARERGWEVVANHREVHTGGELFERPRLVQLREFLRAGEAEVVVAYALDRISRNQAHLGFLLSEWDHLGVRLELVTEELDETPEGRLLQSVRGFVAEVERLKIAERTRRGVRARVNSGRPIPGRKAPYGYRWLDSGKTAFALDPDTAPVARRIFDAVLSGRTLRSTAAMLTGEGIPTPTSRGRRWEAATLCCILKNPAYTGRAVAYRTKQERRRGKSRVIILPESEWVDLPRGIIPPLVTEAEFAAVRDRLERNKALAPRNNANPEATLLRCGFARCGSCGSPLSITKRADRSHMYRCHPVGRDRHGCPSFGVMAPILDTAVWSRVESVLLEPSVILAEAARRANEDPFAADIVAIDRRLATIKSQLTRLAKAVATLEDDGAAAPLLVELQSLSEQAKVLTAERVALTARASEHDADQQRLNDLATWCDRVAGNLPTLTYQEKRTVLDALGVSVVVYRADHEPRWEITMAPPPIDGASDHSVVLRNPRASSTGIRRSMPRVSMGWRRRSRRRSGLTLAPMADR